MSEISKNIVSLIISKEFHKAKTLIHEAMNNKLGLLLEEKLLEYAPTLYEDTDITDDPEYQEEQRKKRAFNQKHPDTDFDKLAKIQQETNPGNPTTSWTEYSTLEDHDKDAQKAWNKEIKAGNFPVDVGFPEFVSARDEAASEQPPGALGIYPTRGYKKPDAVNNALDTASTITNPLSWVPIVPYVADEILNKTASMRQKIGILGRNRAATPFTGVAKVAQWGNKFLLPLTIADELVGAAKETYNDDWKGNPSTAAANFGVNLAKGAAITSLYTPAAPLVATAAVLGGPLALGLAYTHDKLTGAKKGEGYVDQMGDWGTYKPKNIVAGAQEWANQYYQRISGNDPYAAVSKDKGIPLPGPIMPPPDRPEGPKGQPVAAGTVRNSNGQVMYK